MLRGPNETGLFEIPGRPRREVDAPGFFLSPLDYTARIGNRLDERASGEAPSLDRL